MVLPIAHVMNSTDPKTRKQNLTSCLISIQSILNWEGKVVAPALDHFLNKVYTQNKAGGEKNDSRDWQITKSKYPRWKNIKSFSFIIYVTI